MLWALVFSCHIRMEDTTRCTVLSINQCRQIGFLSNGDTVEHKVCGKPWISQKTYRFSKAQWQHIIYAQFCSPMLWHASKEETLFPITSTPNPPLCTSCSALWSINCEKDRFKLFIIVLIAINCKMQRGMPDSYFSFHEVYWWLWKARNYSNK